MEQERGRGEGQAAQALKVCRRCHADAHDNPRRLAPPPSPKFPPRVAIERGLLISPNANKPNGGAEVQASAPCAPPLLYMHRVPKARTVHASRHMHYGRQLQSMVHKHRALQLTNVWAYRATTNGSRQCCAAAHSKAALRDKTRLPCIRHRRLCSLQQNACRNSCRLQGIAHKHYAA